MQQIAHFCSDFALAPTMHRCRRMSRWCMLLVAAVCLAVGADGHAQRPRRANATAAKKKAKKSRRVGAPSRTTAPLLTHRSDVMVFDSHDRRREAGRRSPSTPVA
jgi:hypothetical protein